MGFLDPAKYPHGTRARYVAAKCRCKLCRESNRVYYHQRRERAMAAAAEVKPNRRVNPDHFFTTFARTSQGGKPYLVTAAMCPGANGRPCVQGGAWLKNGKPVCSPCLERATVWNGLVSARRVRKHLLELQAKGIGRDAIAAASDVAVTVISQVQTGRKKKIRGNTERRLLAVDEGARADGALVPSAPPYALLEDLVKVRGFTAKWVSKQLGYVDSYASVLRCQTREFITARNAADIARLHRRVVEQGIVPKPKWDRVDAAATHKLVDELLAEGFSLKRLSLEIGVYLRRRRRDRVQRSTAAKVEQFHRDLFGEGRRIASYAPLSIDDFANARNA